MPLLDPNIYIYMNNYLEGHIFNETQCEPSFVAHKANRGLVHYLIKNHQVMILGLILRALEVVIQVIFKFGLLLV